MIIPAIDLLDGHVVRLHQGDYSKERLYPLSPIDLAQHYQQQGADYLHLVDLTGAKNPEQRQLTLIKSIIRTLSIPLQVGGGIRSIDDIEQLLVLGVQRVVIGSLAITHPHLVQQALQQYGAQHITLAIDVRQQLNGGYQVAINGWQHNSSLLLENVLAAFDGLTHLLCTDISRDGTLAGSNQPLYQYLKHHYPSLILQASGGVHTLEELRSLRQQQIDSVIIGRALLENKFSLMEAKQCWQNVSFPVSM